MKHLNHQTSRLEYAALVFMAIFFLVPVWGTMVSWYIIMMFCLSYFGIALLFLVKNSTIRLKIIGLFALVLFSSFLFFVLVEPVTVSGASGNISLKFFTSIFEQLFFSFFPAFIFYRVATTSSSSQIRLLLLVVFVALLYVVTHSLIELVENPNLSKMNDVDMEVAQKNVANYDIVYAITGIIPVMGYCFFRFHKMLSKLLVLLVLIYLYYFLFSAQYALSFLVSTIALFIVIRDNLPQHIVAKFIFWIITIILIVNLSTIFLFLSSIVESEDMVVRFGELGGFLDSGDSDGDLHHRMILYGRAISDFFNSPIRGNYHLDYNPHSTFLTWLAYTGIIGSLPLFYLYWKTPRLVIRFLQEKHAMAAYRAVMLTLILNGLTNPIHANNAYAMVVFFIAPVLLLEVSKITTEKYRLKWK